jgi:dGTPase
VYADDMPVFTWMRSGAPEGRKCLEAQVMDWADDVAYSVHDVEDGIHGGYVKLTALADTSERDALCATVAGAYSGESATDLRGVLDDLLGLPIFTDAAGYDGSHAAAVALKRLTSVLTGRFTAAAVTATRAEYGPGPLSRYGADLVVPRRARAECALLKGLALRYVMQREGAAAVYARQRELLTELVHLLTLQAPAALDTLHRPQWLSAPDDAARLRVVIDQVASLTDASVGRWLMRLRAGA